MAEMDFNKVGKKERKNLVEQKHFDECCCTFSAVDFNSHQSHRTALAERSIAPNKWTAVQNEDENRKQQNAVRTMRRRRRSDQICQR